ncbi:MAG: serine/threonine-protein kinase [Myxococcaceae bacterium]
MSGTPPRMVGRYVLGESFAAGGMATVHFGLLSGATGFKRVVAIKRMHPSLAADAQARATFLDEARLTSRVQHPNVVPTLDVVEDGQELFLVLEYVHGEALDRLLRASSEKVSPKIAAAVVCATLRGLHAAHEAVGEDRHPLELVHRDLSPPNVMVDVNGVVRVLDFGIARARGRVQSTREGQLKGKLQYLSPEQVHGEASRRSDLFAAGVILFEMLTGKRLFDAPTEAAQLSQVLLCRVPPLSDFGLHEPGLQAVLDRALQREPADRWATAAEMADALEKCGPATQVELAAWVKQFAARTLADRNAKIEALEASAAVVAVGPAPVAVPLARGRSGVPIVVGVVAVVVAAVAGWKVLERPAPSVLVVDAGTPVRTPPPVAVAVVIDAGVDAGAEELDAGVAAPSPRPDAGIKKSTKPPTTKNHCDPPWEIDAEGVKRYKVDCLK